MRALRRRVPVRVVRRPPQPLALPDVPVTVLRAGALGFAGARDEDRDRWLSAFRRLLDALAAPLQVVVSFCPGHAGAAEEVAPQPAHGDEAARRRSELRFAEALAQRPEAVAASVRLVLGTSDADRGRDLLRELGLPCEEETRPPTPGLATEHRDAYVDDAGWHRSWYLDRFPGADLAPGWWLDLAPPGLRIDLAWHAYPIPTGWMVGHLQRQLAALRATQLAGTSEDVRVTAAVPAAEALQRRLAASEERAFRVSLYVTVTADGPAALAEASARVEQAARSVLASLHPVTFEMAAGRLATLPTGHDPLGRQHVLDSSSLVTLFPWSHPELRHPAGLVVGSNRATGMPVAIDPFDQALYANANIGVFGHSGAGKTYLLSCLALGAYAGGAQVFVLDPEDEYGALAGALGGEPVRLALGSGHALNVLPAPPAAAGTREEWLGPAVADAVDLVAILTGGLDEPERALVERAVRSAYDSVPEPVLRDVHRLLVPGRARAVLERWVQGSLGAMFSEPTNVDLDAPFVVFGMRELRDELVPPVHFLLAEALWSRIKARGRRRLLLIDELGLLFEDPTLRRFVVALARRIRKYEGALVFATQNPGDLLASEAGAVVATNPAIHFFGATRPGEAARLQRAFELSAAQRAAVESARRGEFLLSAGAERLALRVEAPPWQVEVMERARAVAGRPARPPPRPS